jgi:hypothetical protein
MRYLLSFSLLILMTSASQAADPSAHIDRAIWIANAAYQIRKDHRWEYVTYLNHTVEMQGQSPTAPIWVHEADVLKQKAAIDSLDQSGLSNGSQQSKRDFVDPQVARANKFYEALKAAGPPGFLLGDYLQSALRASTEPSELLQLGQESRAANEAFQQSSQRLLTVLGNVFDAARADPSYADFINTIFGRRFGANIGEPAETILHDNPDFAANKYVQELVGTQASADTRESQMLQDFQLDLKSEIDSIKSNNDEIIDTLRQESDASEHAASKTEAALERIKLNAEAQQHGPVVKAEAEDIRDAGYLFAMLSTDPELGKRVSMTAEAISQFYSAMYDFQEQQSLLENDVGEAGAGAMSAAMLTFNWFKMCFTLTEAFRGKEKPSAAEITIQAIKALSEQMAAFQKQMNERFDRVDWELNVIHNDMIQIYRVI